MKTMNPIKRDAQLRAHTAYCDETPDDGIDLRVGEVRYQLAPERIADGPAFAQTLLDLQQKWWFSEAVQCDLTNVVGARWMAGDRGRI